MRVLVCGSRDYNGWDVVADDLNELWYAFRYDLVIISGKAKGPDTFAINWAYDKPNLTVLEFPADWERFGNAAGVVRNQQMLDEGKPDLVLAYWDGESRGTKHMISRALAAKVSLRVTFP